MPLLQVLDDEIGIGYPVNIHGDISPLLDQLMISSNNITDQQQIPWNNFHAVLLKKFISLQKDNLYEIELDDDDFNLKNIAPNWNDTPSTLAVMCKIFSYHDAQKMIYFQSCGGASAANLIGRFAYTDIGIENHIKTIIAKEETLNSDVILAEIVHLPESRIGNIIFRPHIRDYEIPYLAQSSVEKEFQIPLQDLYISIKNGIIFLKSKRLNKRIIPRLTTAHNYSMHSMPVYHFLCDLQTHGLRGGFAFRWNSIFNNYPFLPRISYHNVILSLARWIIKTEEIEKIIKGENNMEVLTQWRHDLQMPAYLMFPDGDNEFFVDMNNIRSIKTLLSTVKKCPYIHLQEFPFKKDEAIVRDIEGNHYTNEFIFGFYKNIDT